MAKNYIWSSPREDNREGKLLEDMQAMSPNIEVAPDQRGDTEVLPQIRIQVNPRGSMIQLFI